MPRLLDRDAGVLERFRKPDTLVALDYDGTLAPIVANRHKAVMREQTRVLLQRVAQKYPTVVVTGRAREDAARFVEGIRLRAIIGNHGLDLDLQLRDSFVQRVQEWRDDLSERLEPYRGVVIEDKKLSLSLHYRHSPDSEATAAALWRIVNHLDGARLIGGKDVINVIPEGGPNKADAVLTSCHRFSCARAIFVGDDATDEDVFSIRSADVLGIHVGAEQDTSAEYVIRDQAEIDALLLALLEEGDNRSLQ